MAASVVGSVVFLKIAEFARRSASEQARLRAQLEAVIAVVTAELAPASRLVLDAADGAAVLNHGALQVSGRKGAEGMTGDGIAVAANIAAFADSSRLLASRAFREAL